MEEEDTIIIQVIFKFEDGRLYNFDVDHTTTFYETKKILSNAAHILKNSFKLYRDGQEYSNEYDEQPLQKIFPALKKIEFYLKLCKREEDQDESEHEQISVKYNIKEPCKEHIGKFLVLYCISCKKSICNECFSISHNNHEVEEKADYLMPAKILMERIFANSFMFKSDPKLSNYMSCVSFRSIIKTDVFDRLRQLINELENKCINCLEFFSFNEDSTEKNNDLNLELLKKYCTSSFIKLKNNIDTKEILINDEVFLSLYNKLKAIKEYEISLFTENSNKYKTLNTFFIPFTQEIKNMSIDLNNILTRYINKDIYAKFKEDISKNIVDVIQKEDVVRFMFENLNVPKTKLCGNCLLNPEENSNKNSLTPNIQRLLPSILLLNESKNSGNINKININNNLKINTSTNNTINTVKSNQINNCININSKNNNSINFQQSKENFTISSPIHFSKTQQNFINIPNYNMTFSNNNSNLNDINSLNNINNTNYMNNIKNNNLMSNINNANSFNKIKSSTLNNNINSSNTLNINNTISYNNSTKALNSINITNNLNNTNNFNNINSNSLLNNIHNNTLNSINNPNAINNTNNINNNAMNKINNTNAIKNTKSMNNINSTNALNNINNTNTINNITSSNAINNISVSNSMSNINNTNIMDNMKNYLFAQNVPECSHEATITKEEKDKKLEKTERMDVEESGETPPTQNSPNIKNSEISYSQSKIDEIKANLSEKNNAYTSPIIKKTLISVHLSPSKKDDNFDNKSAIISSNYMHQKSLVLQNTSKENNSQEISNTINSKIETHSIIKNSINNVSIFNGKLIDVLNKEINNNSGEMQTITEKKEETTACFQKAPNISTELNLNGSNITNQNNSSTNSNSKENVNDKYILQKSEKNELNFNMTNLPKLISVIFMYPVYKTNIIKGALDKNTVQEIKINFEEFSKQEPIINEFPTGGAYCNYENSLFFTGGQDYIKEASKLFLSISKNDLNQNATRLPMMNNSHWNHSMIADKGKIYVIGGYNSNKCEVYDIVNKSWKGIPDLIANERQRSMLFTEKNFLYCFMGLTQNGVLDSVERLNLENIEAGWESIIIDNRENINLKFYGAGIFRMSHVNKIFFIGGKKENKKKEQVFKRTIYEFSFDDFKMTMSDYKIENDLEFIENTLYSLGDDDCGNFINEGNGYLISMPNLLI